MARNEPYITPPKSPSQIDRWRQRVSELINQISDGLDVNIQDQTTPTLIVPLNKVNNTTTTSSAVAVGDTTVDVTATTGFVDGAFIVIADADSNRYYTAYQVGAAAGSTVTLDTPIDFAYTSGTQITAGSTALNVDGSSTPQIFSLRASDPGLPIEVDITRIIMVTECGSAVDLNKFGDIVGGLTNGIVLRRTDGTFNNVLNAKTNKDLASYAYDFTVYQASNPSQGIDGFACRLTFGGQNKIGVVIRVGKDEDFEVIIQDDLTSLTSFSIICEGHVVDP